MLLAASSNQITLLHPKCVSSPISRVLLLTWFAFRLHSRCWKSERKTAILPNTHRCRKASRSRSRKMLIVRFALKQVIKRLALPKSLMLNSFAGGFRLPPETDCSNGSGTNSYLVCFGGRVGEFYYRFTWSSFELFKNSAIF